MMTPKFITAKSITTTSKPSLSKLLQFQLHKLPIIFLVLTLLTPLVFSSSAYARAEQNTKYAQQQENPNLKKLLETKNCSGCNLRRVNLNRANLRKAKLNRV